MHAVKGTIDETQKTINKRPTSLKRFPKQMPSYIVAFAVHETYDDIATAQQMICNKRSLQSSASSVSPTISTKTITMEHNSVPKIPDADFIETLEETKVDNVESDTNHDNNADIHNHASKTNTTNYIVVNNKQEDIVSLPVDDLNVISESKKLLQKHDRLSKKKRKNHCRIKNINFKYKNSLKREEKASKRQVSAAKFKETFYSNSVTKIVSRTALLKNAVAKENIHDTVESFLDDNNNNNGSLQSSPSSTKKSFKSNSSNDTLTRHGSVSSKNEDLNSFKEVNSVVRIPPKRAEPYKTDVINVAVAVAYNPETRNDVINKQICNSSEPYRSLFDGDLISTETLVEPIGLLTSGSVSSETSENVKEFYRQTINITSDRTLKPNPISQNSYIVGNTSSEAEGSVQSDCTLAPNSETFMYEENLRQTPPAFEKLENEKNHNRALLDTVINMGIFPKSNPSTSSAVNYEDNIHSVFVTGESAEVKNFGFKQYPENRGDNSKYAVKKSFEIDNDMNNFKNIHLPDESTIKAVIKETEKKDKFCSGELGNYPSNMIELWDRLVLVVDTAVKRLEYSLTDKIISEIKKSLPAFEKPADRKEDIFIVDVEKCTGDTGTHEEVFIGKNKMDIEGDESLQCNLVGNQIIDNIMMKLSVEGPKTFIPGPSTKSFEKIKRPKIFRDYFEVLKPPVVDNVTAEGKGDTVTVSTAVPSVMEEIGSFRHIKSILSVPVAFLKENMLVLTSVPTFFVMLLFVYGLIVIVIKPW